MWLSTGTTPKWTPNESPASRPTAVTLIRLGILPGSPLGSVFAFFIMRTTWDRRSTPTIAENRESDQALAVRCFNEGR